MSWNSKTDANRFKDTYIQGFLDVSGSGVYVRNSGLTVSNDSSFNSNVYINGNAYLKQISFASDDKLNPKSTISDSGVGSGFSNGNLTITSGNINLNTSLSTQALNINQTSIKINMPIDKINVLNDLSVNGNVFVLKDVSLNGNLTSSKLSARTINVDNINSYTGTTILNLSETSYSIYKNTNIYGDCSVNAVKTANIISVDSSLSSVKTNIIKTDSISGIIVLNDISHNGSLKVGKSSIFYSDISCNGAFNVASSATFNGSLNVAEDAILNRDLTVKNNLIIQTGNITGTNSTLQCNIANIKTLNIDGNITANSTSKIARFYTTYIEGDLTNTNFGTKANFYNIQSTNSTLTSSTINNLDSINASIQTLNVVNKTTTKDFEITGEFKLTNDLTIAKINVSNQAKIADISANTATILGKLVSVDNSLNLIKSDKGAFGLILSGDSSFNRLKVVENVDVSGQIRVQNDLYVNSIIRGNIISSSGSFVDLSATNVISGNIKSNEIITNKITASEINGYQNYFNNIQTNALTSENVIANQTMRINGESYLEFISSVEKNINIDASSITISFWTNITSDISSDNIDIFNLVNFGTILNNSSKTLYSFGNAIVDSNNAAISDFYDKWLLFTFILISNKAPQIYINTRRYFVDYGNITLPLSINFRFGFTSASFYNIKLFRTDISSNISDLYLNKNITSNLIAWYPLTNTYYTSDYIKCKNNSFYDISHNKNVKLDITLVNSFEVIGDTYLNGKLNIGTINNIISGYALNVYGEIQATGYNATSDIRLKTNVRPMNRQLDLIKKVNPVNFDWINDGKYDYGFIAQELYKIYPDLKSNLQVDASGNFIDKPVDENGDPIYYTVDYGKLSCILWKGLRDASELIENQQIELLELRDRINRIEKYLSF